MHLFISLHCLLNLCLSTIVVIVVCLVRMFDKIFSLLKWCVCSLCTQCIFIGVKSLHYGNNILHYVVHGIKEVHHHGTHLAWCGTWYKSLHHGNMSCMKWSSMYVHHGHHWMLLNLEWICLIILIWSHQSAV